MPSFYVEDVDIDVDDFLSACSSREIKEVIAALVEDGHLPKNVINSEGEVNKPKRGVLEIEFIDKLELLKEKYYSLTLEDEQTIQEFFKKYL
jgi:hypothetical protein